MPNTGKPNTVTIVTELVTPLINELSLILWDVRFEKEGSSWYLRVFIDKEGGVNFDDCENISRRLDKILDEVDPIEQSYYLEVSSPGTERDLTKTWHLEKYIGEKVKIRMIRPIMGKRDFIAVLESACGSVITVKQENAESFSFNKSEAAYIRVYDSSLDLKL